MLDIEDADDGVPAGSDIDESVWRALPQDIKDEIRAELQAEEAPSASAVAEDPEQSVDTSEPAESWDAGWPRLAPASSLPQGETYEELLALDDQTEAEGLPPNEVARLTAEQQVTPTACKRVWVGQTHSHTDGVVFQPTPAQLKAFVDNGEGKCKICLSGFEGGELLRRLPCQHVFHRDCVDQHFLYKSNCPVCRCDVRGGD